MADDKRERLLSAAKDVFLRYGYKRVSMNDIAEAAGISRPSLYLVFKSKEDVFRGVYRRWVEETVDEIERGASAFPTLEEKLRFAFDLWAVRAFEAARRSTEAEELMSCTLEFAKDEVKASDEAFGRCLAALIASARKGRRTKEALPPERTARILAGSVRGFKQTATDAAELRRMVADLLTLVLD
ncbi:TetR/AcrR family transcriptional regulator [Paludisphaera rhizosphaerae]|uniref:TetR/AcrR family transcriptional regulator n=1 Tax=Paludisphaera rhizosphaerae TaxID=2711216 RepID=UPI0013EB24AD|nr:TetR/AcrR family transcriptional regulator [Paludisphaera rhizosphaerae]